MNIRHTPGTVAAPFGPYSHAIEVPEGSRLLYISGEVGVLPDGTVPEASRPRPKPAGGTSSPSSRTPGWASAIW
jgi:enamine deaminase RidA (YjgF/YER057c/UK114 family)